MKILLTFIAFIGLTTTINSSHANVLINASSDKSHYTTGQKATFTGNFQSFTTGNNDFSKPPFISAQVGLLNPVYKVFYPNLLTEVTNSVTYNQSTGAFSYTTPAIVSPLNSTGGEASLYIEIGRPSALTLTLQTTKAQLDARIIALQNQINGFIAQGYTAAQLASYNSTLATLKESSSVLKSEIDSARELIAMNKVSLQVDSVEAQSSSTMTLMQNGLRYEIVWQNGVLFQNQSTNVTTTVTHVAQPLPAWIGTGFNLPNQSFDVQYLFNGKVVNSLSKQVIPVNQSLTYTYTTPALTQAGAYNFLVKFSIDSSFLPPPGLLGQVSLNGIDNGLAIPPTNLTYTDAAPVYSINGLAIQPDSPKNSGGPISSYAISPTLPKGLVFNTTTGVISGSPTVVSPASVYTITGTNSGGSTNTTIKITVDALPVNLKYASSAFTFTKGTAVSSTPTNSGGAIVSCSISPALPAGLTFSSTTCGFSGTPTTLAVKIQYTVTANDSGGASTTSFSIVVDDIAPSKLVYSASPAIYTIGTKIVANTPTSAGGAVLSYSIAPALPSGLSFNTTNGVITGTPSSILAPTVFTVTASNSGGSTTDSLSITVKDIPPAISFGSGTYTLTKGSPFSATASNNGGAIVSCIANTTLPTGLVLNPSTCAISGTPTALSATNSYGITASNSGGSFSTKIIFTVNDIAPTQLSYTNTQAVYTKGTAISTNTPSNAGGTVVSYSISPALPSGLSFNTSSGIISGTPLSITPSTSFKVLATNTGGSTSTALSITVNDVAPKLTYSPATLVLTKGMPFSALTPSNTGGAIVSCSSSGFPAGLSINPSTCAISGTPTAVTASGNFQVTATNSGGSNSATLSITVNDLIPSQLTYSLNPAIYTKGTQISPNTPSNTGGTVVSYSITPSLPAGLNFSTSTGIITGTPSALKAATVYTVSATDSGGSTQSSLSVAVIDVLPSISYASSSFTLTKGSAFSAIATNSGGAIVSCTVSTGTPLPAGLSVNPNTCSLFGTPTVASATANYQIIATNSGGNFPVTLSLTVQDPTPVISFTGSPFIFTKGTAITALTPNNSGGAITSCVSNPSLPAGLTLNNACVISGAPSVLGTGTYQISATNAGGTSPPVSISITVNDVAPIGLAYAVSNGVYTINSMIGNNSPSLTGGGAVLSYSVNPALPAGMSISPMTGIIYGTPTILQTLTTYTITASNSGGFVTASIQITVNDIPPSQLKYTLNPAVYSKGTTITLNSPSNSGGSVVSYSITPTLPTGLSFSTSSGNISGTPSAASAPTAYTVTATNSGGSTTLSLSITVNDVLPKITYTANSFTLTKNTVFSAPATNTGGAVVSCAVTPSLPSGLSLDPASCSISGTPTAVSLSTNYVVTAANTGGNFSVNLSIIVNDIAPTLLTYSVLSPSFTKGQLITSDSPSNQGGTITSYQISPALPLGLNFDSVTGIISGTPFAVSAAATYTVTGMNSVGSTSVPLSIAVNDLAPAGLTYEASPANYLQNVTITPNIPHSTGGFITSYTITPQLPSALSLDPVSGVITGASASVNSGTYQITGTNSGGSITAPLSITVVSATTPLVQNLISIIPNPNGNTLDIVGGVGASIPGITVNASANALNSGSVVSNTDGSFKVTLSTFTSVTLSATDSASHQSSSFTLNFGSAVLTQLSGKVEDTNSIPLMGVTVSIVGASPAISVVTDANGVFTLNQPITGDQQLLIDGTTVTSPAPDGMPRIFSKTVISVSIGLSQSSALQRPIYLTPIIAGAGTLVLSANGGIVTDGNAPGASLSIPTGVAVFPTGAPVASDGSNQITMTKIPGSVTTIPPFSFALPKHVVALEPSGTQFSQPATLTLPNDNHLQAGTNMVVMSMNSSTGKWELDGIGKVDPNGSTVTTLPGKGITHFSTLYFTPVLNPQIAIAGNGNANGATLSKSVSLPSYKILGQNYTPKLIYNSSWAKPSAFVSNLFDLTPNNITQTVQGNGYYQNQICVTSPCSGSPIYYDPTFTINASFQPNLVTAQFTVGNYLGTTLQSPSVPFTASTAAPYNGVFPARSVVSYKMDLLDPSTHQFFPSGAYQYTANYSLQLTELTLTTVNYYCLFCDGLQSAPFANKNSVINTLFPYDLQGTMLVDNEINSPLGSGWKIGGVQKIANTTANTIVIQEGDGSQSTFIINNEMNILAYGSMYSDANGTGPYLYGVDLSRWPSATIPVVDVLQADPTNPTVYTQLEKVDLTEVFTDPQTQNDNSTAINEGTNVALLTGDVFTNGLLNTFVNSTASTSDGSYFLTAKNYILKVSGGHTTLVAGKTSGTTAGFSGDGAITANTTLNSPGMIILGQNPNTIVFSDTGNNRVRMIDLDTNTITTIAGSGQFLGNDVGDGGLATQASVSHPLGLAYDSLGNLFIATANGIIRKVDLVGNISTFAGSLTGSLDSITPANHARFNSPSGLVIDNQHQYLYVADTGNNRVVRIDFATMTAITMMGGGINSIDDGIAGLQTQLAAPMALGLDSSQNLLVADTQNSLIRKLTFFNNPANTLTYLSTQDTNQGIRQNLDGTWVPYIQRNPDGSWTRNYRNGNTITFDKNGHEIQSQDRTGNITLFAYDNNGNLISRTDPAGRSITYSYSGGKLNSITDPTGRTTTLNIAADGTLTEVVFPDRSAKNFSYNPDGLMTAESDQNQNITKYNYNLYDRLQSVTLANGSPVQVSDTASATAINNATDGNIGASYTYGTNAGSAADTVSDANGNTSTYAKNYYGFMETSVDPLGNTTAISTDPFGRPLNIRKPNGTTITYTYDTLHDITSASDSLSGVSTSQTYDYFGNIAASTNGNGQTTTFTYYPNTNLLHTKTDPLGHVTTYNSYNSYGQLKSVSNYLNHTTLYGYDGFGNLVTVTDPLGHTTTFGEDTAGNVTLATDTLNRKSTKTFDVFNRLTSITTPKNELTQYTYLPAGQLSTVTDPLGKTTTYKYDSMGNLMKRTNPLGLGSTYGYDNNGNKISALDANGVYKTYKYDAVNNQIAKYLPDDTVTMTYNPLKNLTSISSSASNDTTGFYYDSLERLTTTGKVNFSTYYNNGEQFTTSYLSNVFSYTYDGDGNRKTMTDPTGGTTKYSYDYDDRVTSIQNPLNEIYGYIYDDSTGNITMSRPGSSTLYAFDANLLPSSIAHKNSSGPLVTYQLTRDLIGNITNSVAQYPSASVSKSLSYDSDYQLSSATNPESPATLTQNETFDYDSNFNRISDEGGSYAYDSSSRRLMSDYNYSYLYDQKGNLIQKTNLTNSNDVTTYRYSTESKLVGVAIGPNPANPIKSAFYSYDGLGRRIFKTVSDTTSPGDPSKNYGRVYLYDGSNIVAEYDQSNNLLARYTNGLNTDDLLEVNVTPAGASEKIARTPGSYEYLKDQLGSVVDIADTSGNRLQHHIYSAYGMILGVQDSSGNDISANPVLNDGRTFASREFDSETGNYFNRARYYNPGTGRFLSIDPSGMSGSGTNLYRYANNNPVLLNDPTGLKSGFLTIGGSFVPGIVPGPQVGFTFAISYPSGNDGTPFAFGFFPSIGIGFGLNIGVGVTGGTISGGLENISGSSASLTFGGGPLSGGPTFSSSEGTTWSGGLGLSLPVTASAQLTYTFNPLEGLTQATSFSDPFQLGPLPGIDPALAQTIGLIPAPTYSGITISSDGGGFTTDGGSTEGDGGGDGGGGGGD